MVVKELPRQPAGIRVNALAPGAVPGGGCNAGRYARGGRGGIALYNWIPLPTE